jgi:hypothetical protein
MEPATGRLQADLDEQPAAVPLGGRGPAPPGSLDAAWLGPRRTQPAFNLRYEPPLGMVSRVVDRSSLHPVAETVARSFLALAAERLEERAHLPAAATWAV